MTVEPGRRTWSAGANPGGLSELDVAAGVVVDREPPTVPPPGPGEHPLAVLREEATRLLGSPPCVVSFSGGRDSSALLAVYTEVARREGLPDPVAVTARWDDDPMSDESGWQEEVVKALGVREWEVIRPHDDLDLLGPVATDVLTRHGLLWPAPSYALLPIMRSAAGGTLVTGQGGDEMMGLWPYGPAWAALRRRHRPPLRSVARLAGGALPFSLRRRLQLRGAAPYQGWLRQEPTAALRRALAADAGCDPLWWGRYVTMTPRRRGLRLTNESLTRLCDGEGAALATPFLSGRFASALANWGGRTGRGDRTAVMVALFGGLLAGPILSRSTKATFGGVFWGDAARAFGAGWDGRGVDPGLVDAEALRSAWRAPMPVYGAALPLQAAWLASRGERKDALRDGLGHP